MTGKFTYLNETIPIELTQPQKHQILEAFYASPHFSTDEKKALRQKALEDDNSDAAQTVHLVCEYSLPDPELKQSLWEAITDPETKDSLRDTTLKMQGFWQRKQQLDLIAPYFDKYYQILESVVQTRDREFAELFMEQLSPAFMARPQDEEAFAQMLERCSPERQYFSLFLKKQIETMETTSKSRYLCENYKMD